MGNVYVVLVAIPLQVRHLQQCTCAIVVGVEKKQGQFMELLFFLIMLKSSGKKARIILLISNWRGLGNNVHSAILVVAHFLGKGKPLMWFCQLGP
jgi:hypothetical protein